MKYLSPTPTLSTNPVQQDIVKEFWLRVGGPTDIYDISNYIAALEKIALELRKTSYSIFGPVKASSYIENAMRNWPNHLKT